MIHTSETKNAHNLPGVRKHYQGSSLSSIFSTAKNIINQNKDFIKDASEIASNISATKKNVDEIVSNATKLKEIKDIKKDIQTKNTDNSEEDKQKKIDRMVQIAKAKSGNGFRNF